MRILIIILLLILMVSSVSAFTTLSAHQVDFVDQDNKFLVQVIENQNRESLLFNYDASQLQPELPEGQEIIDGEISGRLIKNEVKYPLIAYNDRIYYTASLLWAKNGNIDTLKNECYALSGTTWAKAVDYFWSDVVYCVKLQQIGTLARSTDAEFVFEEEFSVTNSNGQTETVTISQNKNRDAKANVEIAWNRNALTSRFPQDPAISYYGFYKTDGSWTLVSRPLIDSTLTKTTTSYLSSQFDKQECYDSQSAMQQCISTFNTDVLGATRSFSLADSRITGDREDGAIVISSPNRMYFYPIYVAEIDADWLGIKQPAGLPEIEKLESSCFTEGSDGKIISYVSNLANSIASFDYQWDCSDDFFISNLDLIPFDANEDDMRIEHNVYAQTSSVTRGTCTLTVVDAGNPNNRDTQRVDVCVEEQNQDCDLGDQICVAKQPKKCQSVNGVKVYVNIGEECESKCSLNEDGDATCIGEQVRCGDNRCDITEQFGKDDYCPADCQQKDYTTTILLIGGGLALIGGIWYFTRKPNTGGL